MLLQGPRAREMGKLVTYQTPKTEFQFNTMQTISAADIRKAAPKWLRHDTVKEMFEVLGQGNPSQIPPYGLLGFA
jgi:hypothetical protein